MVDAAFCIHLCSAMATPRKVAERGTTILLCRVCGNAFARSNCHIRNSTHSCSRECARAARPKRIRQEHEFKCQGCGSSFSRRQGYSGPARFCSIPCARRHASRRGSSHPNWKGGVSDRSHATRTVLRAKIRAVGKCERCRSTHDLQGHHIAHHADAPDLRQVESNIIVLCARCHALEHPSLAPMITRPRERLGEEIVCGECGKIRYVRKSSVPTAKFCSKSCQLKALHRLMRARTGASPRPASSAFSQPLSSGSGIALHAAHFAGVTILVSSAKMFGRAAFKHAKNSHSLSAESYCRHVEHTRRSSAA